MPLFDGPLENRPVDPSEGFNEQHNHFFLAQKLACFDPRSAFGKIRWEGFSLEQRVSYHQVTLPFANQKAWIDVPPSEYEDVQDFPFLISFVTPKTVRLRLAARPRDLPEESSLMLDGEPPTDDSSWKQTGDDSCLTYIGPFGSLKVERDPFHLEFWDASGQLLTRTLHPSDSRSELNSLPIPFSFVRRSSDLHRHLAATFSLSPGERLFGGGESFTRLDKRGQKLVLWTCDAYGAQTPYMYKPVPFFMSSRGYGMFVHTSAPTTFDLGHSSRPLLRRGGDSLPRRRRARPVHLLRLSQGDPLRVHGHHRSSADAATVDLRAVDGARELLLGGGDPCGSEEAARESHPLRRDPPRHRVVGGAGSLRLRVLLLAL